jgi:hypothetical protein
VCVYVHVRPLASRGKHRITSHCCVVLIPDMWWAQEDAGVIAWSSTGDAFVIRDLDEFVNSVLLKYFRRESFIRVLGTS